MAIVQPRVGRRPTLGFLISFLQSVILSGARREALLLKTVDPSAVEGPSRSSRRRPQRIRFHLFKAGRPAFRVKSMPNSARLCLCHQGPSTPARQYLPTNHVFRSPSLRMTELLDMARVSMRSLWGLMHPLEKIIRITFQAAKPAFGRRLLASNQAAKAFKISE